MKCSKLLYKKLKPLLREHLRKKHLLVVGCFILFKCGGFLTVKNDSYIGIILQSSELCLGGVLITSILFAISAEKEDKHHIDNRLKNNNSVLNKLSYLIDKQEMIRDIKASPTNRDLITTYLGIFIENGECADKEVDNIIRKYHPDRLTYQFMQYDKYLKIDDTLRYYAIIHEIVDKYLPSDEKGMSLKMQDIPIMKPSFASSITKAKPLVKYWSCMFIAAFVLSVIAIPDKVDIDIFGLTTTVGIPVYFKHTPLIIELMVWITICNFINQFTHFIKDFIRILEDRVNYESSIKI